jgi:hypothetical protein
MREWIPAAILFIYTFGHFLSLMGMILNFTLVLEFPQLWLPHLVPALVIYILQMLPSRYYTEIPTYFVNIIRVY